MHLVTLLSADNVRLYSCSLLSPRIDLSEAPQVGRPVLVCAGNLRISATEGREIAYLKIGTFSHPLMMRTKIWRVKDTLIFGQPTPGRFWTLEIPFGRIDAILSQVCNLRPKLDVSEPVEEEADNTDRGPSAAVLDAMETCKKRPQSVTSVYSDEHLIPQRSTSLSTSLNRAGSRDSSLHELRDHEAKDLDPRRHAFDRLDSDVSRVSLGGMMPQGSPRSCIPETTDETRFDDPDDEPLEAPNPNASKYSFLDSDDSDEGHGANKSGASKHDCGVTRGASNGRSKANGAKASSSSDSTPAYTKRGPPSPDRAGSRASVPAPSAVTIPPRSPARARVNVPLTINTGSSNNGFSHEKSTSTGLGIQLDRSEPAIEQSPHHVSAHASRSTSMSSTAQPLVSVSPRQGLEQAFTPVRGSSLGPYTPSKSHDEPKSPSPAIEQPVTIATDPHQSAYKNEVCRTLEAILVGTRHHSSPSEESFGPLSPTGLAKNPVFIATPTQTFAELEAPDDLFAPDSHFTGDLTFDIAQTHLFKHPLIPASIYPLDSDRPALRTKDLIRVGTHASNSEIGSVGAYISWQMINRICPPQGTLATEKRSGRVSSLSSGSGSGSRVSSRSVSFSNRTIES